MDKGEIALLESDLVIIIWMEVNLTQVSTPVAAAVCQSMVYKYVQPYQRLTKEHDSAMHWYVLVKGELSCWRRADKQAKNVSEVQSRSEIAKMVRCVAE